MVRAHITSSSDSVSILSKSKSPQSTASVTLRIHLTFEEDVPVPRISSSLSAAIRSGVTIPSHRSSKRP
nr:MAG TPA: hypothetical protein [Caudoviricetes sp.]DAV67936.1 MAG TPA: hypothetical protein [Caudoviricetes sp.]